MEKYMKMLLFGEILKIQSRILGVTTLGLIIIYKKIIN